MNKVRLNTIGLNGIPLNRTDRASLITPPAPSGGDIPSGYEEFIVTEGVFSASNSAYYVKL